MLILLPPSETKRPDGGDGVLDLGALAFPGLTARRRRVLSALRRLPLADAAGALGLGPQNAHEARWNRALTTAPVVPAIHRYTGVLYDGIGVPELPSSARNWIDAHVVIASALFGLLRAPDPVPPYRLSAGSRLPGLTLKAHWSGGIAAAVGDAGEWVLDARSAAYTALGPVAGSAVLHVETAGPDGVRRAVSHDNKHAKGDLVQRLARSGVDPAGRDDLLDAAPALGLRLEPRGERDVALVV